ncbi:MAG: tyrosine-type recombinase/integrase [Planctomycetes bacterium]|nr:tyrosine-type recombinase/integrase [Planctomycetota bacterium]
MPIGPHGEKINPVRDYLTKQLSDATRKTYISCLRSFIIDYLDRPDGFRSPETLIAILASINVSDAAGYRDALLQTLTPATVAKKMSVLSGIYEHLKDAGLLPIPRNPFRIPRPKVSTEGKTPGMSKMEAERLLAQPDLATKQGMRDYCLLLLLFFCGLRRNEVRLVSTEDFITQGGHHVLLLKGKGDSGKTSMVKLRADIWDVVEEYIRRYRVKGYLFTSLGTNPQHETGKPLSGTRIWLILKHYLHQAGLSENFTVHSTRVTSITNSLQNSCSLAQVQRQLGRHSDPKTTMRYARFNDLADNAVDHIDIRFRREG